MIAIGWSIEQVGQMSPILDADLRQSTALAAFTLDTVPSVAMLIGICCIVRTELRARAGAKLLLGELAFYGDTLLRSAEQHVDTGRSRFFQAAHLVLEDKRRAAVVFEEGRSPALGGHILEQIEAVEGVDRAEHALG